MNTITMTYDQIKTLASRFDMNYTPLDMSKLNNEHPDQNVAEELGQQLLFGMMWELDRKLWLNMVKDDTITINSPNKLYLHENGDLSFIINISTESLDNNIEGVMTVYCESIMRNGRVGIMDVEFQNKLLHPYIYTMVEASDQSVDLIEHRFEAMFGVSA